MSSISFNNITNIDRLLEVHPLIIDHLKLLIPTKLLRVNKTSFNSVASQIYETVSLDEGNVQGFLYGVDNGYIRAKSEEVCGEVKWVERVDRFKITALRMVKNLYLADWTAVTALTEIHMAGTSLRTQINDDYRLRGLPMICPNVQHLHIGPELLADIWNSPMDIHSQVKISDSHWMSRFDDIGRFGRFLRFNLSPRTIAFDWPLLPDDHDPMHNAVGEGFLTNFKISHNPMDHNDFILVNVNLDGPWIPKSFSDTPKKNYFFRCVRPKSSPTSDADIDPLLAELHDCNDQSYVEKAAQVIWDHYCHTVRGDRMPALSMPFSTYLVDDPEGVLTRISAFSPVDTTETFREPDDIVPIENLVRKDDWERCICERTRNAKSPSCNSVW